MRSWASGCQERPVDLVKTMAFEYISFMGFCLDIDGVSLQPLLSLMLLVALRTDSSFFLFLSLDFQMTGAI